MNRSRRFRFAWHAGVLLGAAAMGVCAAPQTQPASPPPDNRLPLKANLVLTPEFCATKSQKGSFISGKETFAIGEALCPKLEQALSGTFAECTRLDKMPEPGNAPGQVTLFPKFLDVGATRTALAKSKRELVILIEWTVQDSAGRPLWIQTVEGSAHNKMGNMFTAGKHRREIIQYAVDDLVQNSAQKMVNAPELRKIVH